MFCSTQGLEFGRAILVTEFLWKEIHVRLGDEDVHNAWQLLDTLEGNLPWEHGRHIQAGAETIHPASEYQRVRAGRGVRKTSSFGIRSNVRKEENDQKVS